MNDPVRPELQPPRSAEWLTRRFIWRDDRLAVLEDLREDFYRTAAAKGARAARLWYWKHVLRSVLPCLKFSITWSLIMFINYLKVAFRYFKRHKGYALLNLSGLVIGLTCSILIFFWVWDELSYDRFHEKSDRIHRVVSNLRVEPAPLAPMLKRDYPEIRDAVRIFYQRNLVRVEEQAFYEENFGFADSSLFDMFTLPFVSGDPQTALAEPYSVVLTEDMALKYFGLEDPLGRTLRVDDSADMKVTGVMQNPPSNSTLRFSLIASIDSLWSMGMNSEDWGNHVYWTYILLDPGASVEGIQRKIENLVRDKMEDLDLPVGLSLQPLNRIHLHAEGHISYAIIFSSVAVFILLVAFINFINLTTARSENRSMEVGVRKISGADRLQLIRQFLGEAVLFSAAAFLMAVLLVRILLPVFNGLSGKSLTFNLLEKLPLLLGLLGVTIFAGLASGSYPALFLSSFQPANIFRKTVRTGAPRSRRLRKTLIVCQFSLSIFLLIATMAVRDQLQFIRNKDVGFDKEHVVYLPANQQIFQNRETFQERLRLIPDVLDVTAASSLPSNVDNKASGIDWEGNQGKKKASWRFVAVDYDYIETLRLEMAAGRSFSRKFPSDLDEGFIVNEEAVREMKTDSPIGKRFSLWGREGALIGVVKDFHIRSLHTEIKPLLIWMGARYRMFMEYVMVRITPGHVPETIRSIENTWGDFCPMYPFEYGFLDESFGRHYRAEERMGRIFSAFTFLAVFISCLGLFGLAAYTAELKTKEIGIRKVFGATASSIVVLMSSPYIKWILVSNLIAWPAATFYVKKWLENFAYQTSIAPMSYLLAGLLSIVVALLTVGFQSFKAAAAAPVNSLRYE